MSASDIAAAAATMRYNRYLYLAVVALVVFVLYIIVNLLPIVKYMGNPRSGGLFGGIFPAAVEPAGDETAAAGQINVEVPRSQMGAAERKRRRELAKERCTYWKIICSYDLRDRRSPKTRLCIKRISKSIQDYDLSMSFL